MQKEELKKNINDKISEIISLSQESEKSKVSNLIADLMSLKSQDDVVPTLYDLPVKDVIKEYDFGAGKFIVTKKYIIYHLRGGMSVLINPRMTSVYGYLKTMLSLRDKYDTSGKEVREAYDALFIYITTVFNLPLYVTVDDQLMADIVNFIIEREYEFAKEKLNKPLQDETPEENAAFENEIEMLEELGNIE